MDLKERLALLRLKNKYKGFSGIKEFKIRPLDELTEREKEVLNTIDTDTNRASDRITLGRGYSEYLSWSEERIAPYAKLNSEIIIVDDYGLVFVIVENIGALLESYFREERCHSIYILNRKVKKWIAVSAGEYFLEYFEKDIY